jgi:hypothetical protein
MRAAWIAFACLLLAGVTPSPTPSPTPGPSFSPALSPSPLPTPLATPTVLMLGPGAPPQILWVGLSSTNPKAGDTVSVTVVTSSNVASVELRVGGFGGNMNKTDAGHFESSSTVPRLPFFIGRKIMLQVIARNTAGTSAEQDVPLQIR